MPDSLNWLDELVELDAQAADLRDEVDQLRARLAKYERPDDDEPATDEWLVELLGPERKVDLGSGFEIQFYESMAPVISVSEGNFNDYEDFCRATEPPKCETRRDVRRIIAALKGE